MIILCNVDGAVRDGVKPVRGSLSGIFTLRKMGHRVVFVTACSLDEAKEKMTWLQHHRLLSMGNKDFIVGELSLIRGDVLIDGSPHNLEGFKGTKILYDLPHNREETRFNRIHSWVKIVRFFRRMKKTDPKWYKELD